MERGQAERAARRVEEQGQGLRRRGCTRAYRGEARRRLRARTPGHGAGELTGEQLVRAARSRSAATAVAVSLIAFGLIGCGKKSDEAGAPKGGGPAGALANGVLARVNDSQLTEADLQRLLP